MKMKHTFRMLSFTLIACIILSAMSLRADASNAYAALMHGRMAEASALLQQALAANGSDATTHLLLCRAAYAQELSDQAVSECERASQLAPNDSQTQMWFGRALGMKASRVNPVSAFSLAKRVRTAFERAVQLDPANVAAASDLGEFYIGAPSFLGGGAEKTLALAGRLMSFAPAKGHRLLGLQAERSKNLSKAEMEFKAAVTAGPSAEAYNDLALFYQESRRPDEAAVAAKQAIELDRTNGPAHVDSSSILIAAVRDPEAAETALRAYLASNSQSDSAPAFKVHLQLGRLLAKRGDTGGAHAEYVVAAQLAPQYQPARKALGGA